MMVVPPTRMVRLTAACGADALVFDRRFGQSAGRIAQADDTIAFARTVGHDAEFDLGALAQRFAGDIELGDGGDENPRLAVVDDVGQLAGRQIGIYTSVVEPGSFARAAGFEVAAVVLHKDRIVVQALEAAGPE